MLEVTDYNGCGENDCKSQQNVQTYSTYIKKVVLSKSLHIQHRECPKYNI